MFNFAVNTLFNIFEIFCDEAGGGEVSGRKKARSRRADGYSLFSVFVAQGYFLQGNASAKASWTTR
jgi:hypothetical protein